MQETSHIDSVSNEKQVQLVDFLNKCGIICESFFCIEHMVIPREILIQNEKYSNIKAYIATFKKQFSSSYLTSLQNTAQNKQRWPLLNLVRQILKSHHFKLTPRRLCDGYNKDKKKKYRRVFIIEKMLEIPSSNVDISHSLL
tara:strand:- start:222 stop:647 length:426 start_codon:yes stop_codon:yes gene_type:complete